MAEKKETGKDEEKRPKIEDWDAHYRETDVETMPWYYEEMDPDLAVALDSFGIEGGTALDLGTGPGTQAMAMAELGLTVTATDLSATAVRDAAARAREKGLDVAFLEDDILKTNLTGKFDVVFDRGCFHTLDPERRKDYVKTVGRLLKRKGHLFLKVMSHMETALQGGPHRFNPGDIHDLFEDDFVVYSIEESVFHGTLDPEPLALFCVLIKR